MGVDVSGGPVGEGHLALGGTQLVSVSQLELNANLETAFDAVPRRLAKKTFMEYLPPAWSPAPVAARSTVCCPWPVPPRLTTRWELT